MRKFIVALFLAALTLAPAIAQNGLPGGPGSQIPNSNGNGGGSAGGASGPSLANVKTLAYWGDSFEANAGTPSLNVPCTGFCQTTLNGSYETWAQIFSGYSVFRNVNGAGPISNCGWSGQTTAQILGNWSCVLASGAQLVRISAGTNDAVAGISCAVTTANNREMYALAAGVQKFVIKNTIVPRPAFTLAQANTAQCVNEYDRRYAEQNSGSFMLVDMDRIAVDPAQPATFSIVAGFLAPDATHPSQMIGGPLGGALIASAIRQFNFPWRKPQMTNGDVYDAVNNPTGNILPNGVFCTSGTGCGTAGIVTNCTGTSPTGVNVLTTGTVTGLTCALSMTTLSDGRNALNVTLGGTCTCTNGVVVVRQLVTAPMTANVNLGDTLEGQIWAKIGANTGVSGINPHLQTTENAASFTNDGALGAVTTTIPTSGISCVTAIDPDNMCVFLTPRRTTVAVPTQIFQDLQIQIMNGTTAVSGVVTIASDSVRKVFN